MKITDEMLHSAIKKAVELGLIPKYSNMNDYIKYWDIIKQVLQAALD